MIRATQNNESTAFENKTESNTLNRITVPRGAITAMTKRLSVFLFTFFALFAPTMSAAQNPEMNNGIFAAAVADTAYIANCINASDQASVSKDGASSSSCVYSSGGTNYGHISDWNTSNVTDMTEAFRDQGNFNQDISGWDVSSVTNMTFMFRGAASFNADLSGWSTASVTNLWGMFREATSFNADIGGWTTGAVTSTRVMFQGSNFNQDISGWDVSNVTHMNNMFKENDDFNQDISGWDVSSVQLMQSLFAGASAFDQDIRDWDTGSVIVTADTNNYYRMFNTSTAMIARFGSVAGFDTDSGSDVTPSAAFFNQGGVSTLDGITGVTLSPTFAASTQNYTAAATAGALNLSIDLTRPTGAASVVLTQGSSTSSVTVGAIDPVTGVAALNAATIVAGSNVFSITVTSPDSSDTTTYTLTVTGEIVMPAMTNATMLAARSQFQATGGCGRNPNQADFVKGAASADVCSYSAGGVDYGHVSDWNVSQVTDMEDMFNSAGEFNQDISAWDVSNVTNMRGMFQAAANFNQDIGDWTVSNVEDMTDAFESANAFNADISGWDVSGVTTMRRMFQNAHAFNQNIGGWDVSNVTNMGAMFTREILATDPPGTVMALDQDIRDWTVGNSVNLINMFANNPAMIARFDGVTGFGNSGNGYTPTSVFFNQGDVSTLDGFTGVTTTETFTSASTSYTATATAGTLNLGIDLSRPRGTASVVLTQGGTATPVTVGAIDPVTGVAALSGFNIAAGSNVFSITVTSPDASDTTTYTLSVTGTASVAEAGIAPSANAITVAEGSTATFTVQLSAEPTASVTVTPSAGDASEVRFIPATLTFTTGDWNTPQTVTVAGVFDTVTDGTQTSTLTLTAASTDGDYSGITSTVAVTTTHVAATTPAAMNDTIFDRAVADATYRTNCLNEATQTSVAKGAASAHHCVYYEGTTNYGHISDWNTSNVTDMSNAFNGRSTFDQDISNWNTANVTNMLGMFQNATNFNQDISGWNTKKVTNMRVMFQFTDEFNQPIGAWDTASVTDFIAMFHTARKFNADISDWKTESATNMSSMFKNAADFDRDIRDWKVDSGDILGQMFNGATKMDTRFGSVAGFSATPTAAFFNKAVSLR